MLSLVQMRAISLNEAKIVHGRQLMPYIPPKLQDQVADAFVKNGIAESKEEAIAMLNSDDDTASLSTNDAYNSIIQREIEQYDKRTDQLLLASESIVQAYNEYISAKFDKAIERVKKYNEYISSAAGSNDSNGVKHMADGSLANAIDTTAATFEQIDQMLQDNPEYNKDEFRRTIIEGTFYTSNNPDLLKRQIQLRMNYNSNIVKMMQKMLQTNYQILGFSKDEALLLSQKMSSAASKTEDTTDEARTSIKTLKAAVLKNKDKFDKGNGVIDMRSIGAGVIFGTKEETGLDDFVSIDRMLQTSLRWDCIIFGHGSSVHKDDAKDLDAVKKKREAFEDKQEQLRKKYEDNIKKMKEKADRIHDLIKDHPQYSGTVNPQKRYSAIRKEYSTYIDALIEKNDKRRKQINKLYSEIVGLYSNLDQPLDEIKKQRAKIEQMIDRIEKKRDATDKLIDHYIKTNEELLDKMLDARDRDDERIEKLLTNAIPDDLKNVMKDLDKEDESLDKEYESVVDRITKRGPATAETKKDYRWVIQPVNTLKAGPFTDMNDLVRQAIKEGFKSIFIVSCNPGHHELDPDIKKTKGVRISHAMNSLLAESVLSPEMDSSFDMEDPIDETEYRLYQTEQHMLQICNECGIDYFSDELLDESSSEFATSINEAGIASKVWSTLVSIIKKAIATVVSVFKKLIDFFKSIIERIKAFFGKIFGKDAKIERQLRKSFNTKFIIVENAGMKAVTVNNWDDLQKGVLDSCNKIAAKIQNMEREQTELLKKTQQFAEQQEKKAPQNESVEQITLQHLRSLLK